MNGVRFVCVALILSASLACSKRNSSSRGTTAPAVALPGVFQLLSPANNATSVSKTATLSWSASAGASFFQLRIALDAALATIVYAPSDFSGTTTSHAIPGGILSDSTVYYWEVTARNSGGTTNATVRPFKFTTASAPPPAPGPFSLVSPSGSGVSTTPVLQWTNAAGETGYIVQIASNSGFTAMVHTQTVGADVTSYSVPAATLAMGTTYFWRSIADNAGSQTLPTNSSLSFTTTSTVTPDFAKSYGGAGSDGFNRVIPTADGGYLAVGWCALNSFGATTTDGWVVKLNGDGTVQWEKRFSGSGRDMFMDVIQIATGKFVLAGLSSSYTTGNEDVWVTKLLADGTLEWMKSYGGASLENAYSIRETTDLGYIVCGDTQTAAFVAGNTDALILKLTENGGLSWTKTVGGTDWDSATCIRQAADDGFVFSGDIYSLAANVPEMWVVKLSRTGANEWQRTLGSTGNEQAHAIAVASDGFIVAGDTDSIPAGGSMDAFLAKFSLTGSLMWSTAMGGPGDESVRDLIRTSNGELAFAGYTSSFGASGTEVWCVRMNSSGTILSERMYQHASWDEGYSIRELASGGLLLGGKMAGGAGLNDGWVLKVASNGALSPIAAATVAQVVSPSLTAGSTTFSPRDVTPTELSWAAPSIQTTNATIQQQAP